MPKVKATKVVSCTSESSANPSSNLLLLEPGKTTHWCNVDASEDTAEVVLQLETPSKIVNINVGNWYSAKIEVFVGCSGENDEFKLLLPSTELMNESESRNGVKFNAVRTFITSDFEKGTAGGEKWDLVKVICKQPYVKSDTFGLTFIHFYTDKRKVMQDESEVSPIPLQKSPRMIGKFKLRDESPEDDEPKGLGLLEKWKKREPSEKIVTPPQKKVVKPSAAVASDRNRMALLYDSASSDEENRRVKHSAKKLKKADEERKRKSDEDASPVKKPKKAKNFSDFLKENPVASTSKPDKSPKREEKKKENPASSPLKPKRKLTRPFKNLLNDVTIVISGIQNPERADVRQKAIEMGARYAQNWQKGCTHLICAFKNTPKFREVKGEGKIVTKEWITNGHRLRKRLPWRRYALDDADRVPDESEEEVFEETANGKDDVLAMYDLDYNIPDAKIEDVYSKSTDDESSRDANPMQPKLFQWKTFYIHANFDGDMKKLEEVILEQNGKIITDLHDADFILTSEKLKGDESRVKGEILDPKWVTECIEMESLVPTRGFTMKFE